MANVIHPQTEALHPALENRVKASSVEISAPDVTDSSEETPKRLISTTVVVTLACLAAALLFLGGYFAWNAWNRGNTTTASNSLPAQAQTSVAATSTIPLSAAELKELQARDEYAVTLSKALHARLPEYKNVTIFADNWTGNHAPKLIAPRNAKVRTGDNLMLVFWSPANGTARGLSDFTKSRAAQEAISKGFAEFQFVDPSSYCFSLVTPVAGAGPISCGIR